MSESRVSPISHRADVGAILVTLVLPTLVTWLYFVVLNEAAASLQQGVFTAGKVVQFAFPIVWVLAIQRRRLRLACPKAAGVIEGIVFGLAVLVLMLLLYHGWLKPGGHFRSAGEAICRKVAGFGIDTPAKYILFGVFYSLAHSFLEEYYYRWFIFGQLRRMIPLAAAVVVSSLGFTAHHVIVLHLYFGWSWITLLFSAAIAIGGAAWAWIYHRGDSLIGPWLSHLLVDATIFIIGYDLVGHLFGGA